MRKLALGTCLAIGLATGSMAHAQIQVIGSTIGKDCYQAAIKYTSPEPRHDRICTKAIEAHTLDRRNLAASYVNRGILRMRRAEYDLALKDYNEAVRLRPALGATYLNQGAAMIGAGHPQDGIVALQKALELDTQDPHIAHYNLGLAYELTGDVTAAYHAFQKSATLAPEWQAPRHELERFSVVPAG